MDHFYKSIQGWFNFHELYTEVVNRASDNCHFVEVGSWKGASAAYMAVEIINSGKNIKFDCVDTWKGSSEHKLTTPEQHESLYNEFIKNMESVKHVVNPIRACSVDAAKLYSEKRLDFVFIDASHDYDSVLQDLNSWFPKIKVGGLLAGHDYQHFPVRSAVEDFCKAKNLNSSPTSKSSWKIDIN